MSLVSIVVSVYNEAEIITDTITVIRSICLENKLKFEVIAVNDGSKDRTAEILNQLSLQDPTLKVIHFSRNFGHEAAMLAGLEHAKGDCIIFMDGDLQHPPSRIPEMVAEFEKGFDAVMMIRYQGRTSSLWRRAANSLFYKTLNWLSDQNFYEHASDFFLISRRAANVIQSGYREKLLYLRGFAHIIGFRQTSLTYHQANRTKGHSKYNIPKLVLHMLNSVILFSDKPLHAAIFLGFAISFFSISLAGYSIVMKFLLQQIIPGYTTLVVFFSFAIGVQLIFMGILAQYIRSILHEVRHRPHYLVDTTVNISK
jgi:polyisoprenyl-phosphate glycosyltransferase